jgi:hypothetical protein
VVIFLAAAFLANELLGLGAVRHLVSPNQFHYAHIGEWATAFPNTVLWASPRVRERARARHVNVDFTRDHGQIFFGMRLPLLLQRQKAEAAIRKIHWWQPQRILLSHGRCFDADADKVIRRIFGELSR